MRTSIVLDNKLIERAQKLTGIKTKREVVQEAVRLLILLYEQGKVRALGGKLLWDGNLNDQRLSRVKGINDAIVAVSLSINKQE